MRSEEIFLEDDRDCRGTILVFVALVLVAIFGFLAFGIDVVRLHGASSEQLFTADHLAMGATQVYLDYEPTTAEIGPVPGGLTVAQAEVWTRSRKHQVKYQKAYDRVLQLGLLNRFVGQFSEQFIRHPSELGSGLGAEASTAYRASIVPGRWWPKRPDACDDAGVPPALAACPCSINNAAIPDPQPCFQPCDPGTGCLNFDGGMDPPYASAFRITLKTRPSEGIKNIAAGAIGIYENASHGTSTSGSGGSVAAALPKFGVLLLDVGRPSVIDAPAGAANAYLPFERGNAAAREYAYRLTAQPAACGANGAQVTLAGAELNLIWEPANVKEQGYRANYTGLSAAQKLEYFCYHVPVNGGTEYHLVATGGPEPQPLTNMMRALHETLKSQRNTANAADRFSVLAYDERNITERFLPFTDVETVDYDRMLLITDVDAGRVEAAKAGFFPMSSGKSDLGGGLLEGVTQIQLVSPIYRVDPFVTIFSNGLTQCERVSTPGVVTCSRYPVTSDSYATQTQLYTTHLTAMAELPDVIIPNMLSPNGVRVHVITGGLKTVAQTVLIRNPANPLECLSDIGLRQYGYMNVIGNSVTAAYRGQYLTLGDGAAGIYEQAAVYMYAVAMSAQGSYMPWRPRCEDTFGPGYLGPYASLSDLCQRGSLGPAPSTTNRVLNTTARAIRDAAVPATVLDAQGRLLCSPSTDTPQETIEATSDSIIEVRPIFLVSEYR